jgi:hypothetical protein
VSGKGRHAEPTMGGHPRRGGASPAFVATAQRWAATVSIGRWRERRGYVAVCSGESLRRSRQYRVLMRSSPEHAGEGAAFSPDGYTLFVNIQGNCGHPPRASLTGVAAPTRREGGSTADIELAKATNSVASTSINGEPDGVMLNGGITSRGHGQQRQAALPSSTWGGSAS